MRKFGLALLGTGALLAAGPVASAAPVSDASAATSVASAGVPGTYVPLFNPVRIMDTRSHFGAAPAAPNGTVVLPVAGHGAVTGHPGVPASGVSAVVVTVTVTGPTAAGVLSTYAAGTTPPATSTTNFVRGETVANVATVQLGTNGAIALHNHSSGTTQLVLDVRGYYLAGSPVEAGTYAPVPPTRVLDTRLGLGESPLAPNTLTDWQVAGHGGVPPAGVSAVGLNVTVTRPTAAGVLTVFAKGDHPPGTSTLNFRAGQTVDIAVIVKVGDGGQLWLQNQSAGTTQVVADVVGYYIGGRPAVAGAYLPIAPTRIIDTRRGHGLSVPPPHQSRAMKDLVYPDDATAVVLTATVTQPAGSGYLRVGSSQPTSDVNFRAGQTVSDLAIARSSANTSLLFENGSAGTIQIVADVSGYFLGATAVNGAVSGFVTTQADVPITEATVNLYQEPDLNSDDPFLADQGSTDSSGRFTIFEHYAGQDFYVCMVAQPDSPGACYQDIPWPGDFTGPPTGSIVVHVTPGATTTLETQRLPPT